MYQPSCSFQCFSDDPRRFLLARLHMDNLVDKSNRTAILKAIEELPDGFEGTYRDAMNRIDQQTAPRRHMAYRVLSWISYAFRPLSLVELQYALAVGQDTSITEVNEDDLDDEVFLTSVCAGLVIVSGESRQVGLVRKWFIQS